VIPTTSDTAPETDLPVIPAPRDPRCPLHPPAEFKQWREEPGLRRVMYRNQPTWVLSRYRDIREALVDPRLSAQTVPVDVPTNPDDDPPVMFARTDDPEHNRLRRMMTRDFTFRRAESWRPQIQKLVDDHLDAMIDGGSPADLVREFALPIPSLVIAIMLGVPTEDLGFFQHQTSVGMDMNTPEDEKVLAFAEMYTYIRDLVDRKEHDPGDDMITRLVQDNVLAGQVSRETAAINGVIMMQAGHETTANMIALGTVALLEHPDVYSELGQTEDSSVVANIIEELMRYLSIVHSQVDRIATEDLEIGGQLISKGDLVVMNIPAGNWDAQFVAHPEDLDVHRNPRGHLGFGYGAHQCIGQNLARVEMQVAFSTLARRLPGLRLAVPPDELKFKGESDIYGMKALPVAW
jgi:cytochrome P450